MRCAKALAIALALALSACGPAPTKPSDTVKTRPGSKPVAKTPAGTKKPDAVAAKTPVAPQASLRTRYENALELLKQNQFKDAESLLLQITKEAPEYSGPHTNLGILYAKTQRREPALAAFARAVAANPRNATALNWTGTLYREAKDYARAEQHYLKALATDSDYEPALLNLGILYGEYLNQPQKALDFYKRYRRKAPNSESLKLAVWIAELEAKLAAAPRKS